MDAGAAADAPVAAAVNPPVRTTLVTLEIGRFVAALAVVLYHYTAVIEKAYGTLVLGDAFRAGHVGVPYFFVLSGFIIYHVHRGDIGAPGAWNRFAAKRAVRLYPMFWLIAGAMLVGFALIPTLAGERVLTAPGIAADLLLLPHSDAILTISWTLRHEIVFYALFSLAIWFGPRAFWAIALWIAISLICAFVVPERADYMGLWSTVTSPLNLGFGIGMLVAEAIRRPPVARPSLLIAIALLALTGLAALEWRLGAGVAHAINPLGKIGDIAYLTAAGLLVYGLVCWESGHRIARAPLWKTLGGASYILYLVHPPIGSVLVRLLQKLPLASPTIVYALLVVIAVAGAILLHRLVEKPILRLLSGVVNRATARPAPRP